jgi:hypothetical protein
MSRPPCFVGSQTAPPCSKHARVADEAPTLGVHAGGMTVIAGLVRRGPTRSAYARVLASRLAAAWPVMTGLTCGVPRYHPLSILSSGSEGRRGGFCARSPSGVKSQNPTLNILIPHGPTRKHSTQVCKDSALHTDDRC